jgi:dipeptidyl aminopeptidase/acylaminoacyl peptidase
MRSVITSPKLALFALFLTFCLWAPTKAQSLTVRQIMAEPSIAGMRASGEKLSPDGGKVVYLWNAEGKPRLDLYLASDFVTAPSKILSPTDLPVPYRAPEKENKLDYGIETRDEFVKARENQFGNFEWSPDSEKLIFTYGGDVYLLPLDTKKPRRLTVTQAPEAGARFIDNDRIMFTQSGNVFVMHLAEPLIAQLTKEANPAAFKTVGGAVPTRDGKLIAYVVSDSSKQKSLVVPNYLPELTAAGNIRRGWTEQQLFVTLTDGSRNEPFEIKLPKPEGVSSFRRMVWAADNRSLIVDRLDKDTKRRQLFYVYNVGSKAEKIILITEETDDKWQASLSSIFEANPSDPAELFFGSERDGFNHLYLATLDPVQREIRTGGEIRAENPGGYSDAVKIGQLTKGNWQVEWAKWDSEGSQIIFSSTEKGYTEREFFSLSMPGGEILPVEGPGKNGMRENPQMSEGSQPQLLYEFSQWNRPGELHVVRVCPKCRGLSFPQQITRTATEAFAKRSWTEPKFIEIPSRDGKKIPAKIYLPPGHKAGTKTKYPMVIFVHGAGYLQNIINGWNNYYREFMFNDMLAKKGFVVLDIDYRGSAGYGRDWRTDVHDFLGGKDYDDHIDSIDHMVATYGVDQKRIGVYGGSYGGFIAGMLAMRAPERIAAAAALRPVFDWKNYFATNPFYTAQRLGFPDKNPEAYKRSSPISYADKLERPLLILHGMSDSNVHVQDSVQLMEKLIRLGKTQYFEVMLYPSENHGFERPESWADEYERILAFFEKHLNRAGAAGR